MRKINQRRAGVALTYLSLAVNSLSGLIYTPVMLRLLGQNEYGLYQLVSSVVSNLGMLNFGFSGAYIRFYSRYKVSNEKEEIARLNGMYMVIFLALSVICILCGSVMVANAERIFGEGLTAQELGKAKILMWFMVLNMAFSFPNSVFDCCITAHEQFVFQRLMNVMRGVLNPFITLPLLIIGYGSVGMVLVSTLSMLFSFILNMRFTLKRLDERFLFKGFRLGLLKEMWVFTFYIFLNSIIDQINWSVDKFLLGRFAGTVAVAVYGVGAQLNSMYLQFSTAVSGVFTPQVNRVVAESNNNRELTALFTKVGRIQFLILSLILSEFVILGESFINLWAGAEYGISYYVALLLIVPVTVPLIQNLGIEIQRAKNMHKTRSVVYLFIAILNVLLSIPLVKMYGAMGAAVGTAVSLVLGNIVFMNWYYQYRIGLDMLDFWKSIISLIPAMSIPLAFGICIRVFVHPVGIVQITAVGAIYYVVFCFFIFKFGMNLYERGIVLGVCFRIKRVGIEIYNFMRCKRE